MSAEELVRKLNQNTTSENINEYFGKYVEVTGEVKKVIESKGSLEVQLDGKHDGYNQYQVENIVCMVNPYASDDISIAALGSIITVSGKLSAMTSDWGQLIKSCNL